MKLDSEFLKLPLRFDAQRLVEEVDGFADHEWRKHPQGHVGNTAIALIASGGRSDNDDVKGPMRPTPELDRCPYLQQVLLSFNSVWGRTRLMRIAGNGEATAHVDTNYYWMQRVRVHVPVLTYPEVEFQCGGRSLHMAAGECWLFDTWRLHNVLNHNDKPRIHLVADTVGSAEFWELAERAERPFTSTASVTVPRFMPYEPDVRPELQFESANFPVVMSPWEQECLLAGILEDLADAAFPTDETAAFESTLRIFHRRWRTLWARFGDAPEGDATYRTTLDNFAAELGRFAKRLSLPNGVDAVEAVIQAIVRPGLNPQLRTTSASPSAMPPKSAVTPHGDAAMVKPVRDQEPISGHPSPEGWPVLDDRTAIGSMEAVIPNSQSRDDLLPSAKPTRTPGIASQPTSARLVRPVFILAAPRTGSSLLFETLARAPGVFTIGGESHELFESVSAWRPDQRNWDSNALSAADAEPANTAALTERILERLRDRDGTAAPRVQSDVRMLEKTPKNALRVSFLSAAFPDARFIYLYREPRANLSSIIEAWRSGRFVTYPQLPDWEGLPWSLLLTPGWRDLRGRPLEEIAAAQWSAAQRAILDGLSAVPRDRWTTITYADFLSKPQREAERLATFAAWGWDQKLSATLPLARHTLTPPEKDKWKKNAAELERVLPGLAETERRFAAAAKPPASPRVLTPQPALSADELRSVHTTNLAALLQELNVSLFISTYQAGKLVIVRADGAQVNTHFRAFPSPMGIAVDGRRLAVGTLHQVWEFQNQPEAAAKLEPAGKHDAAFLPRQCRFTGDIRVHDVAYASGELWLVNTRFSCLCTLDAHHSFVPQWRPPFVSALAPEDRCHLNGLAVVEDKPRYVTALGLTDSAGGWRANKRDGGVLLEVPDGNVILQRLSMPHSPRWHDGRLWLLESGVGGLGVVDLAAGRVETVVQLPGFTRGLDFLGHYAFVGLSQVRESAVFSGLPITDQPIERQCGLQVVDLRSGRAVAFLRFEAGVQEVFAVQVLPGSRWPEVVQDDPALLGGSFLLPNSALEAVPAELRKVA